MVQKPTRLLKQIKFWVGPFFDKELTLYAASLSFYTIFTLIPLLLIILTLLISLSSFSDYYETIKHFIFSNLLPVNSETIMGHIDDFLENSTQMGTLSLGMVFISSLFFFENFEYIANKIFDAKARDLWHSVVMYVAMLLLTPLALGGSFYISAKVMTLIGSHAIVDGINILPIVPYFIIWGFFFLIFQVAANTKVSPKASLISSFIVSVVFTLSKQLFIYYVLMNKSYATMYGSFATLVFLFLWIYLSWVIFIYGLKLCHIFNGIYEDSEA